MKINKKNVVGLPRRSRATGFTLVEILIVIAIIGILAAMVIISINPNRQFKSARDTQRLTNLSTILNAIGQNIAEHKGIFICNGTALAFPTASTTIKNAGGGFDLAPCLVPDYLQALPYDPIATGAFYTATTSYNTAYEISQDAATGRITITAPAAELNPVELSR